MPNRAVKSSVVKTQARPVKRTIKQPTKPAPKKQHAAKKTRTITTSEDDEFLSEEERRKSLQAQEGGKARRQDIENKMAYVLDKVIPATKTTTGQASSEVVATQPPITTNAKDDISATNSNSVNPTVETTNQGVDLEAREMKKFGYVKTMTPRERATLTRSSKARVASEANDERTEADIQEDIYDEELMRDGLLEHPVWEHVRDCVIKTETSRGANPVRGNRLEHAKKVKKDGLKVRLDNSTDREIIRTLGGYLQFVRLGEEECMKPIHLKSHPVMREVQWEAQALKNTP
jgi:hypothetical protein